MTMAAGTHVIVVGLGIAGSGIAATLAQRGFRVTAVEQFSPLHDRGSSHGDTRIFRRVPHEGDVYVGMAAASYDGWKAWNAAAKDELFVECGGIDAGPEASEMVRSAEELCWRYEQPFEVMSGETCSGRFPHFHLPADWRVVYQAKSGVVRPDATRTFLHAVAREAGARLMHETPVRGIEADALGVTVRLEGETLRGDFVVVSAGSWLPKLLPEVGLKLLPERRVLAWHDAVDGGELMDGHVPVFIFDADGGWYGMPTPGGRIKFGHDKHLREPVEPDQGAAAPGTTDEALLRGCVRYLRGFREEPSEMKACIYTITEDHHFLVDWHPAHGNVLMFSACSGHGFKYAPVYGDMAADLISGKDRPELAPFRLGREVGGATRFAG
jgi:sarcosine oxidase